MPALLLTLLTNSFFPSVTLDCKPNLMRLHLNFTEPFRGVVSVGRSSWDELGGETTAKEAHRCSIRGQGSRRYRLDLDHRSCRTTFDVRMCSVKLRLICLPRFTKIFLSPRANAASSATPSSCGTTRRWRPVATTQRRCSASLVSPPFQSTNKTEWK